MGRAEPPNLRPALAEIVARCLLIFSRPNCHIRPQEGQMDYSTVAQVSLPAAGLVAYLFRHWWWPPGPEAGPPLLAQ
jgi:hypothetical protein